MRGNWVGPTRTAFAWNRRRIPRSPRKPTTFFTTSSKPGTARSAWSAARSAGCSHATAAIWVRILRGRAAGRPVGSLIQRSYSQEYTSLRRVRAPVSRSPRRHKSLIQVRDQVLHVFDADGQAHQAVGETHRPPHLGRHAGVSHRGGMADEAPDAAQGLREGEQPGALDEARGALDRSQLDRDHAAEALHLAAGEVVLGM